MDTQRREPGRMIFSEFAIIREIRVSFFLRDEP